MNGTVLLSGDGAASGGIGLNALIALLVIGLTLAYDKFATPVMVRYQAVVGNRVYNRVYDFFRPDATLDVLEYFGEAFANPADLLRGMAAAPFHLSGSRGLEFFVRGASSTTSDWDFYTYFSAYCVGLAIRTLSTSGVVWDDVFQPLRDIANAPSGHVIPMHAQDLMQYLARAQAAAQAQQVIDVAVAMILATIGQAVAAVGGIQHLDRIRFPNAVTLALDHRARHPAHSGSSSSPAFNIITGRTTHNGTHQKVQLIFKPNTSPLELVLAFYASSVQCCITGFGAFHLFYSLAAKREGIFWHNNSQHPQSASTALVKYETRGWKFSSPAWALSREVTDMRLSKYGGSKFLEFRSLDLRMNPGLEDWRKWAAKNIKWEVSAGETRYTPSQPKGFRDLLQNGRRIRIQRGGPTPALVAARQLAIQHSVAFHAAGHYAHPDEVTGF